MSPAAVVEVALGKTVSPGAGNAPAGLAVVVHRGSSGGAGFPDGQVTPQLRVAQQCEWFLPCSN